MPVKKEAKARIKINKLLERAGWRFFDDPDDPSKPANIQVDLDLEACQKMKQTYSHKVFKGIA